eukprot:9466972-Pyramimonas_sp.AAC.1
MRQGRQDLKTRLFNAASKTAQGSPRRPKGVQDGPRESKGSKTAQDISKGQGASARRRRRIRIYI